MKIDKITIKSFKVFKDISFKLHPKINVIIGDNASGKTTLLDALSISASSLFFGFDNVKPKKITTDDVRNVSTQTYSIINLEKDDENDVSDETNIVSPTSIVAEWLPNDVEKNLYPDLKDKSILTWKRVLDKPKKSEIKEIEEFAYTLLKRSRSESGVIFPVIAHYGVDRFSNDFGNLNYQFQKEGVEMAYPNKLSTIKSSKDFLEWYKTQEDYVQKFSFDDFQVDLLKAFKSLIENIVYHNYWKNIHFDRLSNEMVGTNNERIEIKYSQLSDGYRNIVSLFSDIAYRAIQLNPHLGRNVFKRTPGIVMIDCIELGIHPNWQKSILYEFSIAFPNIQFIVTTQSAFIVQSVSNSSLINLRHA